jgi:hypothetical protein
MPVPTNDLPQTPAAALKTTGSLTRQHAFPKPRQAIGDVSMRKPNGRLGPLVLVAACAPIFAGCKEDLSDQQFGVLDLASVYDGGSTANPAAGVPERIAPLVGYLDGERAQYYDFGNVPAKRNPLTGEPLSVAVNPIYFFFDTGGRPLFSTSVRETRDGTDWMRGGIGVLNPNPIDFCAGVPADKQGDCKKRNDAERKKPYGVRARDVLKDKARGDTADYQRPIVDAAPGDGGVYTGLWEVYEVVVADGYVPDSVKHKGTMDRAIAAHKMTAQSTQKVINCPIVDERTAVTQGVTERGIPHPRIELWYRRQLTFCYLANGWETIGNQDGTLIHAGNDGQRVDTFDVEHLVVGNQTRLVVPISRAYIPTVLTTDQGVADPTVTHVADNILSRGRPKHVQSDPPGYSPIRWVWDLEVESSYVVGSLNDVGKIDLTNASTNGLVKNIPMRGIGLRCSFPMDKTHNPIRPGFWECGHLAQNPKDPTGPQVLVSTGDPTCNAIGLECNRDTCYCDVPLVGYGEACGPDIAECDHHIGGGGDDFNELGYTCLLNFCYMRCDPTTPNTHQNENVGKKATEFLDSNCKSLPGYRCLGYESRHSGICVKLCDSNVNDPKQCSATTQVDMMSKDIGAGQVCQDLGIEVCSWPDGFTPAD